MVNRLAQEGGDTGRQGIKGEVAVGADFGVGLERLAAGAAEIEYVYQPPVRSVRMPSSRMMLPSIPASSRNSRSAVCSVVSP